MPGERAISWIAVENGMPVYASDAAELGKVAEVVGEEEKDIFSGIVFRPGIFKESRFIPADLIDRITSEGIHITIDSGEADRRLDVYES